MSIFNKREGEIESSSPCRSVLVTIQEELRRLPKLSPMNKHCIYRVPNWLRRVKEDAYTPVVMSIGPFHHKKNERLLPMEAVKLRHLKSFIQRSEMMGCGDLNTYIEIIKDKEGQIRDSYAEDIPMVSNDFVQMILVDSIFIIEYFCFSVRIDIMPSLNYEQVHQDLLLAENQLPFFILDDLYTADLKPGSVKSFMDFACDVLHVKKSRVKVNPITKEAAECCHLLDLLRSHRLPSPQPSPNTDKKCVPFFMHKLKERCCHLLNFLKSHCSDEREEEGTRSISCDELEEEDTRSISCDELEEEDTRSISCPTAMSLYEAGVKFRVSKKKHCSLLDIHFNEKKGILTIPLLKVEDATEHLHRNLVAFEQCHYCPGQTFYIADYHFFMDCLINTWEDVNLLVENKIVENWLGSHKEVSRLINSLGSHVITNSSEYYYAGVTNQLNDHCNKRWNRNRATLKHTYFKHPWAVLSVIYAVVLLLLTISQLLTGILAVPGVVKK